MNCPGSILLCRLNSTFFGYLYVLSQGNSWSLDHPQGFLRIRSPVCYSDIDIIANNLPLIVKHHYCLLYVMPCAAQMVKFMIMYPTISSDIPKTSTTFFLIMPVPYSPKVSLRHFPKITVN